jgi:hypothetical protein
MTSYWSCDMPRLLASLLAVFLTMAVTAANAVTPSLGLWWNPDEPGRGYVFDRQGGTMVVTIYAYDAGGDSTWYLGAGAFDSSETAFQADFNSFSGGQCLGCAFRTPSGTEFGTISIDFSDAEHAILTYPGGSTSIEHFIYGYGSQEDKLMGYWVFTAVIPDGNDYGPQVLGEYLLFDSHYTDATGAVYVQGHGFADPSVAALGHYDEAASAFLVDVTLPDGTAHHYAVSGDDKTLQGLSKYGDNGPTSPAVAVRAEYYSP